MNTVPSTLKNINDSEEINGAKDSFDPMDQILKTLAFEHPNGVVFEVTCIGPAVRTSSVWEGYAVTQGGKKAVITGYFKDHEKAAEMALSLDREAKPSAIYVSLNACAPSLLGRACERMKAGINRTSTDNIVSLCNLLIDADPVRPEGISSTAEEHEAALKLVEKIVDYLRKEGWPEPMTADSGNGGHAVFKIELENTPENVELLHRCLQALSAMFSSEAVKVDEKVFDAPRISKVYGTTVRKGDDIPDRPHRPAKVISAPVEPRAVPHELLKALADMAPEPAKSQPTNNSVNGGMFDVRKYLEDHGVGVKKIKRHGSSTLFVLDECVFNPDHRGGEAAVGQTDKGTIFYQCFHDSCAGRTWAQARQVIGKDENILIFPARKTAQDDGEDHRAKGEKARSSHLPAPPRFPVEVLPEKTQWILESVARSHTVPIEVPAAALLVLTGAAIGQSRALMIKRGWIEYPNLYLALIGRSGVGKSPATKRIFRPAFEMERLWYREYQEQLRAIEEGNADAGRPAWRQLIVEDASPEALSDALAANPRGIMWYRDELAGLLLELDKYSGKNGATKTRLMSAYDSGSWKVNRISSRRNTFIPHATLSIFGTVQPMALPQIFSSLDSVTGFLPRFIFLRADRDTPPFWTDETIEEECGMAVEDMIKTFLNFAFTEEEKPRIVPVSPAAKMRYIDWYNHQVSEPWRDLDAVLYEALLAKLRGQCLRLCLILHCMDAAQKGCSELLPVSESTMQNAILLTECFKLHQKQIWQFLVNPTACEELSPLQKRVIRAVLDLQGSIRSGMLPTSLITEKINEGINEKFHASIMTIGRVAASLGFAAKHLPGETTRGICISTDDLARLRPLVQHSGSSGTCGLIEGAGGTDTRSETTCTGTFDFGMPVEVSSPGPPDVVDQPRTLDALPPEKTADAPETTCTTCTASSGLSGHAGGFQMSDSDRLLSIAKCEIDCAYTLEKLKEVWETNIDEWSKNLSDSQIQDLVEFKNLRKREFVSPEEFWDDEDARMRIGTNAFLAELDDSFQKSLKP